MATVTPGKTFTSNEIVTPTNLNQLGVPTVSNIVTADLADASVTTAKIADANVTTAKIADANVTTAKIANLAVTTGKLDDISVTTIKLATNAVDASKIQDLTITTNKINDDQITAAKLGSTERLRIAKAWVNFNGTTSPGTIRSNYNVSSVTKNGTGDYTVNFTTAMADANYSIVGMASLSAGNINASSAAVVSELLNPSNTYSLKSTTQVRIYTGDNASDNYFDSFSCNLTVFGN